MCGRVCAETDNRREGGSALSEGTDVTGGYLVAACTWTPAPRYGILSLDCIQRGDTESACVRMPTDTNAQFLRGKTSSAPATNGNLSYMLRTAPFHCKVVVLCVLAAVVETICSEISALSDGFVEESAREKGKTALLDAHQVKQRIEIYPSILALAARMALESPSDASS